MTRGRPPKCPFCRASQSIGKGYRRTKTLGLRRVRQCRQCGRKFTPRYQKKAESNEDQIRVSDRGV